MVGAIRMSTAVVVVARVPMATVAKAAAGG